MAAGPLPERAVQHGQEARRLRAAEQFDAAREELSRALAILRPGPAWWRSPVSKLAWEQGIADALAALGEVDIDRGRPDQARESLEESLRRYAGLRNDESADVAIILNNLGVAYERLGLLRESEEVLRRALEINRKLRRGPEAEAMTLNNLALTLQADDRLAEAAELITEAIALDGLSDETRRLLEEQFSFHGMSRGEYADALTLIAQFDQAPPESVEAAHIAGNLAQAYAELQDRVAALRWQRLSVKLRKLRQPESLPLAIAMFNLSDAVAVSGATAEADELLDEATRMATAVAPESDQLASMRSAVVFRLLERGDPAAAVAFGEEAIAASPNARRRLIGVRLGTGAAYQELGDLDAARAQFEQARADGEEISPLLPELRVVLVTLGNLLLDQRDFAGAAESFDRAIEVAESLRPGSADEPGLGRLFGAAEMAYHGRIQAAWKLDTPEEAVLAFHTAESFRARMLAEMLAAGPPSPAATPVVTELDDIRQRLSVLYRQNRTDGRDELEQRAERLRIELRELDRGAARRVSPQPATLAEVQACLDDRVTLAVYEVTVDGVFLFVVRHDAFSFHLVPAEPAVVAAAVDEVVTACRDRESDPPSAALARLGEWLLRPLAGHRGAIAVCAADVLAPLPFEALELDGAPLITHCAVWSIPSATILTRFGADRRRRRPDLEFAGFAMPATPGQDALPAALREVTRAAGIFGAEHSVVDVAAGVASIRAVAPRARYLHFAMHGLISDERPLFSGFPLAGDDFLHAYQMVDLDLCADLVVCSACETAKGESRAGEGTIGLAYSLFTAGARAVLVSRWPIVDPIVARQVRTLYQCLHAGWPAVEAARQAALKLRERHSHPREWASFALIDLGAGRS